MPIKTITIAIILLMVLPSAFGQILNKVTVEFGYNKSKVINTKKIRSFEGDRLGRKYDLDILHEIAPITDNKNISVGYAFSKKHHLRLRYAKNILGSRLEGTIQITFPPNPVRSAIVSTSQLHRNFTERPSTSWGIIYEYHSSFHSGNIVIGAGIERQRNRVIWETLVLPGLRSRSYSLHSHIGYLSEPIGFVQIHGKVFSTYYASKTAKIYDQPIHSEYIPLQLGIEIGFRINFKNIIQKTDKRRKRKRRSK